MRITSTTLTRPVAATVLAIAVFATGLFSLRQLDVDYLPDITYPLVKITVWWRGATPDEVETNLADPIERAMATVDNVDYLDSSSIEGMYTLLVNFRYEASVDVAYQDVIAAMGRIARKLPPDIDPPVILKADPSQLPIMGIAISSDARSLVWLREWAENWLTDRLTAVSGMAGVEVVGGLRREIRVHLDPPRLAAYGLTPARIAKALYEENREMFAGRVTVETREIIARTMVEVEVRGTDVEPIFEFAKQVEARLRDMAFLTKVNISMDMTKPEYRIYVDRARASAMGISVNQVGSTLRALVTGVVATQYREGSEYYDIRVLVPEARLTNKSDIENLVLDATKDQPVYLRDVAEVRRAVGPIEIVREDQIKQVIVRADSAGVSVGEAVARAERAVAELERPTGVSFAMGGQAQLMAENRRTMGLIIAFAFLFAFVVLAIQFDSFSLPFLIMADVPLALTGAFVALYLAQIPIGVTVLIGLVVMMGGIVSQGVVLLTLAEEYRKQGETPLQAILRAAPVRVRPILMTQLTTVLGLLPLALNLGEGGDMLKPMAIAVIGGLLYSLLLTLLFLPAAYALVRRGGQRTALSSAE